MKYFLLFLLLVGCVPCDKSYYFRAIRTTVVVWQEAGMPIIPSNCFDYIEVIRYNSYRDFINKCSKKFCKQNLTGCSTAHVYTFPRKVIKYRILIAPYNPHEYTTIQHETLHILSRCTKNTLDQNHVNKLIWKKFGRDSLEVIANKEK